MAYINIAEWSSDQVVDWLKGLDNAMYRYTDAFSNNHVDGEKLIHIRSSTLEELGIFCIGHQEIILEAVEHLRNFHFNLDKENLQFLALQVATTARCLYKQLEQNRDKTMLDTDALMDITRTLAKIKPLICWLDRPPFKGQQQYLEIRKKMLTLALEMAISAQRDRFALKPVKQIIQNAEILAKLSDYIIQVISDPMLLQPASLILVTLKKKESDLGFYVSPSFHGIYKVTEIKFNSPAHISGKIEEGDEVVQINYQTVVGWQHKKVLLQLHDSKPDVLLTMKKRPKHVKIYGQIYMKPYRLPSKKRSMAGRWGEANSPRPELLSFNYYPLPMPRPLELLPSAKKTFRAITPKPEPIPEGNDSAQPLNNVHEDSDSDLLTPTEPKLPDHDLHLLFQSGRPFLQRRNTVCGDQTESFKYLSNVKFWQDRRDKSISMGFGMENAANIFPQQAQSQQTVGQSGMGQLNGSMPDILTTTTMEKRPMDGTNCDSSAANPPSVMASGYRKSVRFDATIPQSSSENDNKRTIELSAFDAIPYADEDPEEQKEDHSPTIIKATVSSYNNESVEAKNEALIQQKINLRRLSSDNDKPPAIEPRKEQQVAPTPPPRPKKPIEMSPGSMSINSPAPVPPPKPLDSPSALKSFVATFPPPPVISPKPPAPAPPLDELPLEALELVTPIKQKSLTLKKKNSILAKRRKIAVKSLPHSDIQGHLYRRTKDKSGTSYWAKGYFVLADNALYCFRTKDALKADFLVFLSGFTVSLASEIHSKPFAFRVYHTMKTLYFAAETQEALNQWMDYLRRATMKSANGGSVALNGGSSSAQITDIKEIFTETESSEEDSEESEHGGHSQSATTPTAGPEVQKHEKYHLGLGSLKKFNNPFSSNKNSAEKKHNDLPIPSAQFRSYIKVQGYAGLSPGNHFFPPDSSLNPGAVSTPITSNFVDRLCDKDRPLPSPVTPGVVFSPAKVAEREQKTREDSREEEKSLESSNSLKDSPSKKFQPHNYIHASNPNLVDFECHLGSGGTSGGGGVLGGGIGSGKPSQFTYKDPSLLNGSGGGVPVNGTNGGHSLQGCMTLMDLMLQQQAEDAKEVYNNRVFLGEEKEDDQRRRKQRNDSQLSENHLKITYAGNGSGTVTGSGGDQKIDKIQSRTLPKTPDYAQSFKPDDVDIIMIRSKEGQSLRNFGYEFISEEDPQEPSKSSVAMATALREKNRLAARKTDKVSPTTSWSRRKGLNWINSSDKQQQQQHGNWDVNGSGSGVVESGKMRSGGSGSFKSKALKLDSLKTTDRFFSFNKIVGAGGGSGGGYDAKKSSSPGQSPSHFTGGGGGGTLPMLNSKKGNFFNLTDGGVLGGTKKVITPSSSNTGLDVAGGRKLSSTSTASYFSKLSFSGSGRSGSGSVAASSVASASVAATKEKKIFGSPRLHRAIFGKMQNSPGNRSPIFDEVILGQGTPSWMDTRRAEVKVGGGGTTGTAAAHPMPDVVGTSQPKQGSGGSPGLHKATKAPEYPGMKCPPVFKPETYSLSDPSTSNTLMRRRNNNMNKKSA